MNDLQLCQFAKGLDHRPSNSGKWRKMVFRRWRDAPFLRIRRLCDAPRAHVQLFPGVQWIATIFNTIELSITCDVQAQNPDDFLSITMWTVNDETAVLDRFVRFKCQNKSRSLGLSEKLIARFKVFPVMRHGSNRVVQCHVTVLFTCFGLYRRVVLLQWFMKNWSLVVDGFVWFQVSESK
jgi:hypothetical protein